MAVGSVSCREASVAATVIAAIMQGRNMEQEYVVTRHFRVNNTSQAAAEKEVDEFILNKLEGEKSEPIDAEFREVGKGEKDVL